MACEIGFGVPFLAAIDRILIFSTELCRMRCSHQPQSFQPHPCEPCAGSHVWPVTWHAPPTGLFTAEERERLLADARPWAEAQQRNAAGLPPNGPPSPAATSPAGGAAVPEAPPELSPDDVLRVFASRVRDNLRLVLCLSPVGEAFRCRLRQFPALVSCCTIDWFSEWPAEALR
jgi:P-loop containing dynein motor region D4